jgi:hypothetical protein
MTTFRIDAENNITAMGGSEQIEESGGETETFGNLQELTALAEKWSAGRLVEIWSSLPGVQPVRRFTNRQVATTRIWKALQRRGSSGDAETGRAAAKRPRVAKKVPRAARKERGGNSKTSRVIALLRRPQGATLQAIMKTTGWQTHSVRGFISGKLKKKLGLKVRSVKREGKRVYSIKPH